MPETMTIEAEVHQCVRFIYPHGVVPVTMFGIRSSCVPSEVEPVPGAIGFDFVSLIYFDIGNGVLRHVSAEAETYYWGQEVTREELDDMPDGVGEAVSQWSTAERFLLGSWGGLIPLNDHEFAVSPVFHADL